MKEGKREVKRLQDMPDHLRVVISHETLCVVCAYVHSECLMRQKRGSLMISDINHSQYVQLRSKLHVILNFPEKKNDLLINIDYPGQTGRRESSRRAGYFMCSHQSHLNYSLSCGA